MLGIESISWYEQELDSFSSFLFRYKAPNAVPFTIDLIPSGQLSGSKSWCIAWVKNSRQQNAPYPNTSHCPPVSRLNISTRSLTEFKYLIYDLSFSSKSGNSKPWLCNLIFRVRLISSASWADASNKYSRLVIEPGTFILFISRGTLSNGDRNSLLEKLASRHFRKPSARYSVFTPASSNFVRWASFNLFRRLSNSSLK